MRKWWNDPDWSDLSIYTPYNHEHSGTVSSCIQASTPPKIKLKHLITINSLNAVIITSWWYCMSYMPCAPSPLQMCAICSHWAFIHYLSYLHFYRGQLQYLFICFSLGNFGCCGLYFLEKRKGEVEKRWNKKIRTRIWTETTALNKKVCLLICSELNALASMKPRYVIRK